jgi:hypothetical protein
LIASLYIAGASKPRKRIVSGFNAERRAENASAFARLHGKQPQPFSS